jgi:hypothetical protein
MRRLLVATAVIVFSLTAPAQTSAPTQTPSPAQSQTGEHPSTVCVVSGRVVAAAEGSPLKSARVALIPEHSQAHQEIYGATTDPDGQSFSKRFRLAVIDSWRRMGASTKNTRAKVPMLQ